MIFTLEKTQCLPLYRYTEDGERVSNITEWGLRQFREHYGDDGITAEDIFAYTYAVLHNPAYREEYAVDLQREFPRLPFYADFAAWARMGRELLELHIGFEAAAPYPLARRDSRFRGNDDGAGGNGRRAGRDGGIPAFAGMTMARAGMTGTGGIPAGNDGQGRGRGDSRFRGNDDGAGGNDEGGFPLSRE